MFVFEVSISSEPPSGSQVSIDFSTQDITATAGTDYQAVAGTIAFSAETENLQRISVPVNGDTLFEPNESFFLKLSNLTMTGGVNVIITKPDGIGVIFNDDPQPSGSPTPTPTPTPGVRVEGDVVDANGSGTNGDGGVLANDVSVIRGVLLGNLPLIPAGAQFQAADVNLDANNGCGNGQIDAGDVTVIRRYNLGELALKPACGPTGSTAARSEGVSEPSSSASTYSIHAGRELIASRGTVVDIPVEVEMPTDETASALSFTLGWNSRMFSLVEARLGPDASMDASLAANTNHLDDGKLGLLIDSATGFAAGRQIIVLRLAVHPTAEVGIFPLTIDDAVTTRQIASREGRLLDASYFAGQIEISEAEPFVTISGRVLTADGRGLRNAEVTLVNEQTGRTRTTATSSFGYYSFENIENGSRGIITVRSKRYRFATRAVTAAASLREIDMIALE